MSAPPAAADDFPIDGLLFSSLRHFIDANGGEAAFQGLTTDDVKDLITTIFPRIYARTYNAHPRARVMSFSEHRRAKSDSTQLTMASR